MSNGVEHATVVAVVIQDGEGLAIHRCVPASEVQRQHIAATGQVDGVNGGGIIGRGIGDIHVQAVVGG